MSRTPVQSNKIGYKFIRFARACGLPLILLLGAMEAKSDTQPKIVRVDPKQMESRIILKVPAQYPPEAAAHNISGTVRLEKIVGTDGVPRQIKVLRGHPLLVRAAITAVGKWRYQTTVIDGEAVEVLTYVNVNFHLPSKQ